MSTKAEWIALAERCEKATGPDREIEAEMFLALMPKAGWKRKDPKGFTRIAAFLDSGGIEYCVPFWSGSLDTITTRIEREFPGWMVRVQWCGVSAEAWIAPDLNSPACQAVYRDDPGAWHDYAERNEVEIRPGSRQAAILALCAAFCRAMSERADQEPG